MKKRVLGKDFEVGAVGLGCMGFTHAYGAPMEDGEAIKAMHAWLTVRRKFCLCSWNQLLYSCGFIILTAQRARK